MKGTRALSFLLTLALLASLVIPGSLALPAKAEGADNGMRISKTATANSDGTYTITLEAYATGSKIISEVKTDIPTDIVLVLDQSGSMAQDMNTYAFEAYTGKTNSDYYDLRHNGGEGNLYYQMEDGGYASVSVVRSQISSPEDYTPYSEGTTNRQYYQNRDNLYFYNNANGEYEQVSVEFSVNQSGLVYTYTFLDGTEFFRASGWNVADRSPGNFDGRGPLYYLSTTPEYFYTYSYTDANGKTQVIGTSDGASAYPVDFTLYRRYVNGTISRLDALKNAVTGFADSVAEKAKGVDGVLGTEDDVNHRIAVVGFATGNYTSNSDYPTYENTELFIGGTQYNYNVNASSYYDSAFQNMNTQVGYNNVIASKNALAARGATYPNYGLAMASGIFNAYPIPENEKRNRVVVLFTDGVPGYSSFDSEVANSAISSAQTLKNNSVTVYSVGIFDGADATSAGSSSGNDTQKANWFMQRVSSNNGTPQSPSYYLSASDAGTLSSIFQQIASNIESGGSSATLTEDAVIKDIIAPQFTLPAGTAATDITLATYSYTGENAWNLNNNTMGATATVNGDQVSVTGFDFSDNWCGTVDNNGTTEYRGNKLVISFKVQVKDGFLGGNGVYTNTSAGVYENSEATNPIMTFNRPQVDIAIKDVTVDAQDQNVYLLQDVSAESLTNGTTIKVGNVSLDLSKSNYGLESWQNEYVEINVVVTDKDGNDISSDLSNLTDDSTYTVSVTVSPKTEGTATEKTGSDQANINVYKPVLTYKDSEVYYGDSVPTDFSGNLVSTVWKHGETLNTAVTMIGTAPTLTTTNTPDNSKIANGKINTKQDVPVNVTVGIDGTDVTTHTTFAHQDCVTGENLNGGKFLLHVNTCQLTITKTGGDSSEPYVFTVLKDGEKYSEVTVVGNNSETIYELPVGTYTIEEDTDWSWRYNPTYNDSSVTLSSGNDTGTITCSNSLSELYWLNGFSAVVQNIFGVTH